MKAANLGKILGAFGLLLLIDHVGKCHTIS